MPPGFFARPSDEVAPDLVGKILWRSGLGGGRLTEVEAYLPEADPASHAARGLTRRNAAMFGPAGTIYVFLSYGVHYLLNLVCDAEGVGSAVLVRAFEAIGATEASGGGIASGGGADGGSQCGPGRVGVALGIHPGFNGSPLGEASGLFVLDDGSRPEVGMTTRIGISRGETMMLRYYASRSRCVTLKPVRREGTAT